ncbi:hypothetical protein [Gracilimonas sp.]|uniref:hypothetical protein n=1 Tax=Gracilimonas sp. TaxID=1974203 RepID=UPI003BA9FAC1
MSNSNYAAPRNDSPNFLSRIILFGLMTLLLSPLTLAQDFDANRMNRDIKIMENILGELFKTQVVSDAGSVNMRSNNYVFFGGSSDNIKGTYIPDFGVIFMIPSSTSRSIVVSRERSSGSANVVFQYSSDNDKADKTVDEESVVKRITEFMQDYASTMGQLSPDENVLVIYGSTNSSNSRYAAYTLRAIDDNDEEKQIKKLPVISVSAKKSDLDAYRSGRLNADAFQNRLSVSKSEESEKLDMKVLGNIFRTALEDGDGEQFHLINSNSLSYLYLDNFGALYSMNIHRGHNLGSFRFGSITGNLSAEREKELEELKEDMRAREQKLNETLEAEYENLISKTKEFIIDYGRTLSSLKNNQHLLVSLNISDASDEIPERVTLQVQKSVFDRLDRGQISREAALNAVTLTEY